MLGPPCIFRISSSDLCDLAVYMLRHDTNGFRYNPGAKSVDLIGAGVEHDPVDDLRPKFVKSVPQGNPQLLLKTAHQRPRP